MFAALLLSVLVWQEPKPVAPPRATPAVAEVKRPPVVEWDDKTAKQALDELQKALKGTPNLAQRTAALVPLATGSNAQLVRPLARIVETDKAIVVQQQAVDLIGNQPAGVANPALRRLLDNKRVADQPAVLAAIVRALARCGYDKTQWRDVADLFERSYDEAFVPLHEAVLALVIEHKETQAVALLVRNLDEPVPKDVDAAHNPPAAYWKARWGAWAVWRDKVKDALFAITGQRFSTAAEAQAWLDKNPLK